MDMNDIIARLKNGEDAQVIADEMAKSLNDAVKQVEKESKQAGRKAALAQEIADRFNQFTTTISSSPFPTTHKKRETFFSLSFFVLGNSW